MSEFIISYKASMGEEGLYSNDARDRGGESWKGIARNMNPKWEGWAIIDEIKSNTNAITLLHALDFDEELEVMVQDFYKAEFYARLLLDQIDEQGICDELFDTAINQGLVTSSKYLQQSLNLLNNNQKYYPDLLEDGKVGGVTIKAYKDYMQTSRLPGRSVDRNTRTLLKCLNGLQFGKYVGICEARADQEVFFYGWCNRV